MEETADPKGRVRALVQQGGDMEFNEAVPLRRYFRSASELYRMASVYKEEGNDERALMLYSRFITLLVEKTPKHPEYKTIEKDEKQRSQKYLAAAFKVAEELKKRLEAEYEIDADRYSKELEARRAEDTRRRLEDERRAIERAASGNGVDEEASEMFNRDVQPVLVNTHDIAFPTFDTTRPSAPPMPAHNDPAMPSFDRSTKPKNLAATGNSYLPHNSLGLRDVVVPRNLIGKFMSLAESNTSKNIETCGVLCGKLANNRFVITHLVIPDQRGTSDSCTTDHEEQVFDFQDKYDLITLGWIHTHPSQSAFLSSVDLHTHCSYQLMLPEAIAIVCSPKFNETGIFMLTPGHGLREISACRQTGFHPHDKEPPLFATCPHAALSDGHNAELVDLRRL